jgi:hypothetical protein
MIELTGCYRSTYATFVADLTAGSIDRCQAYVPKNSAAANAR